MSGKGDGISESLLETALGHEGEMITTPLPGLTANLASTRLGTTYPADSHPVTKEARVDGWGGLQVDCGRQVYRRTLRAMMPRVDPVSSLALLLVSFGAKKVVAGLAGDDAAGLATGILAVLTQTEESQSRLIAIEQRLTVVIEKPYKVALGAGTRYLQQSVLPGRTAEQRRDDLERGEAQLILASHAACTAAQRAVVERQLLLTRIARGDSSGARDSWQRLDGFVGDAIGDVFKVYEWPYDEARARLERGDFGRRSTLDKLLNFADTDPRWPGAWSTVKAEARDQLRELASLLADTAASAELVGLPCPIKFPWRRLIGDSRPVHASRGGRIVVAVPLATEISICGVTARLLGVQAVTTPEGDSSGYLNHRVQAVVTLGTSRASSAKCWVGEGSPELAQEAAELTSFMDSAVLEPGQTITASQELYRLPGYSPSHMYLCIAGLVLSANLGVSTA